MRVVCPYAGGVHADTRAVLDEWLSVEYVDVGADDYAYGRLLAELWRAGETFMIVEHDVVPSVADIARMRDCPCLYAASPYPWGQAVGVAMGFTRWRGEFLRMFPDAVEIACRIPSSYGGPGHWRQLDVWLQAAVLRDLYGWQPHAHLPPVEHRTRRVTPPGAPLRTRVEGRCFLAPGLVERLAGEVAASSGGPGRLSE